MSRHQSADAPVALIARQGRIGRITLNRPRALNALNGALVQQLSDAFERFRTDDSVWSVVIDSSSQRAFCAGGDIAEVHAHVKAGALAAARDQCDAEYRLDLEIAAYPKPVVSLVDGQAMGGGMGIACHASHAVATERARFAFPECVIGWVPDSGASHLLSQLPGRLGEYLALTGAALTGEEAAALGIARYFVPSGVVPAIVEELVETGNPEIIPHYASPARAVGFATPHAVRDDVFSHANPAEIATALETIGDDPDHEPWRSTALKALRKSSPLSLALALECVRLARSGPSLAAAIARERTVCARMLSEPDFLEGIRAMMIDRDRRPTWSDSLHTPLSGDRVAAFLTM